tara:strand:+ start:288 stop:695 length:408 start_codon:yes stop_codon:yes gene_type:complete
MVDEVKKTTPNKIEKEEATIVEEVVVEKEVRICDLLAPIFMTINSDSTREHIGDMMFVASTKELKIVPLMANVAAKLENAVLGDASIRDEKTGAITMVSREEEPEQWIRNLVNSLEFSGNPFIADPVIEICDNEA